MRAPPWPLRKDNALGNVRHIRVQWLRLQEQPREEIVELKKVNGKENLADLMTSIWQAKIHVDC